MSKKLAPSPSRELRRRRIDRIVVLALALAAGAATSGQTPGGAESAAQDSARRRTVWQGVYTEAQAERGKKAYGQSCEHCHGADLGGNSADEVPALVFDAFLMTWRDRTIKDLFDRISRSMPHDSPGSLSSRAYLDIVSYILEANQFPGGIRELEPAGLEEIVIAKAPASSRGQP